MAASVPTIATASFAAPSDSARRPVFPAAALAALLLPLLLLVAWRASAGEPGEAEAPADRVVISDFESRALPLTPNNDNGQPPSFERSPKDPRTGEACLKLTYRNGASNYGNLSLPARMCGGEERVSLWLRRESAEEKSSFHIWLVEEDGDVWLSPTVKLQDLKEGWQRINLEIERFGYQPRGNKAKEIATVSHILVGCNFGSFELSVDDLAFEGRGLKAAWDKANEPAQATVRLDGKRIAVDRFMGFGAEWDVNAYRTYGVTGDDFEVILKRVHWMRAPVLRVMMQVKYVYRGGGQYDFEAPVMKDLYRVLDDCQKRGAVVILTEWGCEPQWLRPPEIEKVEDPRYAEAIGTYLQHLLVTKGYTCIKHFVLVNEPNYEVKEFERWAKGVRNVAAALKARKLSDRVVLTGSDHSNAEAWHEGAVKNLPGILGAYDFHRYASPAEVDSGQLEAYVRRQWAVALAGDAKAKDKPLIVGEAGLVTPGFSASNNPLHLKYEYGVYMADYAVQAASAGSWAVLAWMLDDNSHNGFTWGMWSNRKEGMKPKPWFYAWSLLCRSFPAGSRIYRVDPPAAGVRVLAGRIGEGAAEKGAGGGWSFCLVNRNRRPAAITIPNPDGRALAFTKYVYSREAAKADEEGFPAPVATVRWEADKGMAVEVPAESVVVLTTLAE